MSEGEVLVSFAGNMNVDGPNWKVVAIGAVAVVGTAAVGWYGSKRLSQTSKKSKTGAAELQRTAAEFMKACLNGDVTTLKLLRTKVTSRQAAKFVSSESGSGPLLLAVQSGNVKAVEYLVEEYGMDLDVKNKKGMNPFHVASMHGDGDIFGYLYYASPKDQRNRLVNAKVPENGWHVLHIASVYGYSALLDVFVALDHSDVVWKWGVQDAQGSTPLILACWNGHSAAAKLLIGLEANLNSVNGAGQSALYVACRNGRQDVVEDLLEWGKKRGSEVKTALSHQDRAGYTPLHAACMTGNPTILMLLLKSGAAIDAAANDGSTSLHMCARMNKLECARVLLMMGCTLNISNCFGATALHVACLHGNAEIVELLLADKAGNDLLSVQDYDGEFPLHAACKATHNDSIDEERILKSVKVLMSHGAQPNVLDYSNSTPLFCLCWAPKRAVVVEMVKLLLSYGADGSLEADQGWGPLHVVNNFKGDLFEELKVIIEGNLETINPHYLDTFDPRKARDTSNRGFARRRGAHNRIPVEDRQKVFNGDLTLQGVAKKIANGDVQNIVVMTGAGISVNAGLPDYRSADRGMYTKGGYSSAFNMGNFLENPSDFFDCMRAVFLPVHDGHVQPTRTHRFIRQLQDRGILLRQYTQNVDMLERAAGVTEDHLVESHGTLVEAFCINTQCGERYSGKLMDTSFWKPIREGAVPRCLKCKGLVRPDVVFFGEGLPAKFHDSLKADCEKCDMLIVMGTSMVVYPFASIPNQVPLLAPRVLMNKEAVGPFRDLEDNEDNYRDVAVLGDCDESVKILQELLGWSDSAE